MSSGLSDHAAAAVAGGVPAAAAAAVLVVSEEMPKDAVEVAGYDFSAAVEKGAVDYDALLSSYLTTGFQATNFGLAVEQINEMLRWRLSDEPLTAEEMEELEAAKAELPAGADKAAAVAALQAEREAERANTKCKVFLGYTSNMASAGVRETIRFLAQHKLVDVIVCSAGGIEEDFIKCLAPTFLGDFALPGRELRLKGQNRIGNLVVPNKNYTLFEDWLLPILDAMLDEQEADPENVRWTPSRLIHRLGKEINDERSIYYWCWKNNIPVYSPAITDGSIGDMLYFHSFKRPGLVLDLVEDIRGMNGEAVHAKKTGAIIIGGGMVKHHIMNANLMRNGCDYAVYLNTAQESDGSDAGARPDEAVSWGKIRLDAKPVKIYAEATLVFPLLVAQTFAKHAIAHKKEGEADDATAAAAAGGGAEEEKK